MPQNNTKQQFLEVRRQAAQLVTQLGADSSIAASFLQSLTALEHSLESPTFRDNAPASSTGAPLASASLQQSNRYIAELHEVLRELPTGICILHGREHNYTFTNPIYEQFAGRTDMVGKPVREVFPEVVGQGIFELLDQIYTTGVSHHIPERLIRFDRHSTGELEDVYFDLTYVPLRDADGMVTGIVNYVTDVSERRALEAERAHVLQLTLTAQQSTEVERQRLLDVLLQAPAAICTLAGPEHVFTFTNPRYDELVGRQDLVGHTVRAALPEIEGQGFFELLDAVYTTGEPFVGREVPIKLARSTTGAVEQAFVSFVYAPLRDGGEQITGIFVHATDVTELVVARQQAETAVVLHEQFLSIAAHELKTPLASLLGYIGVLQRRLCFQGDIDDRVNRALTMLGTQSQRLARLIEALLDVARIQHGHLSLETVPLDLGTVVMQVVDEVGVTLEHRDIRVTVPADACIVMGDSVRLEQVVVNLVQNAVKYSPEGGAIEVTVGCTSSQGWLRVRDQGIGIPEAALPHLFERFYRVTEGKPSVIGGMGLGLAVTHEIVTLHGGTITVESTEGEGSAFTVWLPLAKAGEATRGVGGV